MKKYMTRLGRIQEIEIERETNHYVWCNGHRNKKKTGFMCFFDTFDEAKKHLIDEAENQIKENELRIESLKSKQVRLSKVLNDYKKLTK